MAARPWLAHTQEAYARMLIQFGQASDDQASFCLQVLPSGPQLLATSTTRQIIKYASTCEARLADQTHLEEVIRAL